MTQTSIQEVIEEINSLITEEYKLTHPNIFKISAMNDNIKLLKSKLPKERQDLIDAYDTAKYKQESDPDGGAGMGCYYVEENFGI